jgi:hypothetical protein
VLPLPLARSIRVVGAVAFAIVVAAAAGVKMSAQNPQAPSAPAMGPNVNMVVGPTFLRLPGPGEPPQNLVIQGDPLQNPNGFELSCAMTSRNSHHIICFANDNRVVDVLGVDQGTAIEGNGDSTIGVFQSIDGGGTWASTVHPGFFPKPGGYDYAADPGVGAGAAGMIHSVGLFSNRGDKPLSAIYHSAWIDLNDQEGDRTPVKFLFTSIVDTGSAQRFEDRPTVLVSPPVPGGPTCTFQVDRGNGKIVSQTVPASPIHVFWIVFQGSGNNMISQIWTKSSPTDCGRTYTNAYKMSEEIGLSQGITVAQKMGTQTICAAWRKGTDPQVPEGISVACSNDGGMSYAKAKLAAQICPVDWNTSPYRFRTRTAPTLAADASRFYLGFAVRPGTPAACVTNSVGSRIVVTTSTTGSTWSTPAIVDSYGGPGFQLFPQFTRAGNLLNLVWFDSRLDVSGIFGPEISEVDIVGTNRKRHSIDVFGTVGSLGAQPAWTTPFQVSKYTFGRRPTDPPGTRRQLNFNFANLRLFARLRQPGLGDFIAAASEQFVPANPLTQPGVWTANTGQLGDTPSWTAWADNRNVRLHSNEVYSVNGVEKPRDWAPPALPSLPTGGTSIYVPTTDPLLQRPACNADFTGMRNQDPYGVLWTRGSLIGTTGNNRPMLTLSGGGPPRSMSVFAQNFSRSDTLYQFNIVNQPPGGRASFNQSATPLVTSVEGVGAPSTTVTRTAFVTSTVKRPPIRIDVYEIPLNPVAVSSLCVIDAQGNCTSAAGVTVRGVAPNHGFPQGEQITITGADPSSYNGTFTVNVTSSDTFTYTLGAPVTIEAAAGTLVAKVPVRNSGRFARTVWFNADPTVPDLLEVPATVPPNDPAFNINQNEVFGVEIGDVVTNTNSLPTVTNPGNWANPGWEEPGWEEPGWEEPGWEEPGWEEPGWEEPGWEEPGWEEPGWEEAGWETNNVSDSQLSDTSIHDVRFPIKSTGNTIQTVKVSSLLNAAALNGLKFQLVVYRLNTSSAAGPNSCNPARPTLIGNKQVLVNIDHANVSIGNFATPSDSTSIENATVHMLPGETLWANLRMFDTTHGNKLPSTESILLRGQPGGVGTQQNTATPTAVVSALSVLEVFRLPVAFTGNPYSFQAQAVGGRPCPPNALQYSWTASDLSQKGLSINTAGLISGTPVAGGPLTLNVTDNSCTPGTDSAPFNLTLVTLPGALTQEATSANGAAVSYTTSVSNHNDAADGPMNVVCAPSTGSTFALFPLDAAGGKGHTTTVACSAADSVGNTGSGTFAVTVRDTTPPTVTGTGSPATFWASSDRKVAITVSGQAIDTATGVSLPSGKYRVIDEYGIDQPTGTFTFNANGTYSFVVSLTGTPNSTDKNGRVYQIFVSADDIAANHGESTAIVVTAIK